MAKIKNIKAREIIDSLAKYDSRYKVFPKKKSVIHEKGFHIGKCDFNGVRPKKERRKVKQLLYSSLAYFDEEDLARTLNKRYRQ